MTRGRADNGRPPVAHGPKVTAATCPLCGTDGRSDNRTALGDSGTEDKG